MNIIIRTAAVGSLLLLGGCVVAQVAPPPIAPPISTGTAGGTAAQGFTCYAGVYVCPVPASVPVGSQCSCPGLGAPSFGVVN